MDSATLEERQLRRLNSAAMSLYGHAHQRGGGVGALAFGRLSLSDAADLVLEALPPCAATDRVALAAERVRCLGVSALVTAWLDTSARVPQMEFALRRLAGRDYPAVLEYIARYADEDGDGAPDHPREHPAMTRSRLASALLVSSARTGLRVASDQPGTGLPLPYLSRPPRAASGTQVLPPQPPVRFDPVSMVTSVPAVGHYYGSLEEMAPWLDPRAWSLTAPEYWSMSRRVERRGNEFVPLDLGRFDPPLGTSWSGLLEERVVMCASDSIMSGYSNRLNIDFRVSLDAADPTRSRVWVGFSLYQCDSSVQLMRFAPSGMDVDEGFADYQQFKGHVPEALEAVREPDDMVVRCMCKKTVRYSDLLSRRTSGQGGVGAGEVMNYLAPGVLGLWLDYVVAAGPHTAMKRGRGRALRTPLEADHALRAGVPR